MLRCLATTVVCALFTLTTPLTSKSRVVSAATGEDSFRQIVEDIKYKSPGATSETADAERPRNERVPRSSSAARIAAAFAKSLEGIGEAIDARLDLAPTDTPIPLSREAMCHLMQEVATENYLPTPLFARLIWQESKFKPNAVSHVGARGIAQFMPATAAERGLENPFDPVQALPASAEFLRELTLQFGNFGLAAAAYNGGPGRVGKWLSGKGGLPDETRNYVIQITGRTAEYWAKDLYAAGPHPEAMEVHDCNVRPMRTAVAEAREEERMRKKGYPSIELANAAQNRTEDGTPNPPKSQPQMWMAVLAGNWSEQKARSLYADLKKKHPKVLGSRTPTVRVTKVTGTGKKAAAKATVGIAAETQAEAKDLCDRMKAAGGSCVVKKDPAA
jgi:soluble lytic murein transglycosylase-like protein